MIKRFLLLRNIGQFSNVDAGKDIELGKLTVCYADNGRGKTTLASVLRSLADGSPNPIAERKRLRSLNDPHVVIEFNDGSSPAVFKGVSWSRQIASLVIFDDTFVEQNVYSGLTVSPRQRQHLYDLILGPQAVELQHQLAYHVEKIENHNRELRDKAAGVPESARRELSLEDFCALPVDTDVDRNIQETEFLLAAARDQDAISSNPAFEMFNLPRLDLDEIQRVLEMDLDSIEKAAFEHVQSHLNELGQDGEKWVSDGVHHIERIGGDVSVLICPFCAQSLDGSSLIMHYRAYFSDAYTLLKRTIAKTLSKIGTTHGDGVQAEFESKLRIAVERRQFWARFCEIEEFPTNTSVIHRDLRAARESILSLLTAKQASPLEKVKISEEIKALVAAYESHIATVAQIMQRLERANRAIREVKERVGSTTVQSLSNRLNRLKLIKFRHTPIISEACDDYLQELNAKSEAKTKRDQTRQELDHHRTNVFPKYEADVNRYLEKFGTSYQLKNMKHANLRIGSTSTYDAQVGGASVAVGNPSATDAAPSFSNVFSGGDRTTLAFAFFLASLEQLDHLGDTVVVIDDPISSMDADRSLTTVQEIRALTLRAGQVIVLSHDKRFLCRIWEHANHKESVAFEIARSQDGSTLRSWNVAEDSLTEHDRRHFVFQEYLDLGTGNMLEVARNIRLHLEGFLRTACPQDFPPGSSLGNQFVEKCHQNLNLATQILSQIKLQELRDILEYAHKFHHDTNHEWASQQITDGELRMFVERALKFTKP